MCMCRFESEALKVNVQIDPQPNFVQCILPALMAALPVFLQAFMECVTGGASDYQPGDRQRCG